MKSRQLVAIAIAVSTLGMTSASFAEGPMQRVIRAETAALQHVDDRRNDRAERRDDRRDDRADDRRDRRADRRDDRNDRWDDRPNYRPGPQVNHYYYHARGPEFRRGHYIPREYRNRQYVVVNHYQHRLAAPPRGHQWVQVGSDYVLIAIATGLIANIILNN
jgi:Ni/Co efflux regulator RcnB